MSNFNNISLPHHERRHFVSRQNSDAEKKLDQAVKDMEYYHREAETMRARYNDVFLEKERLEQEVNSVRCCLEDERKERGEIPTGSDELPAE